MATERTARERFVEAIKEMVGTHEGCNPDECCESHLPDVARQAIDAFADAECDAFQDGDTGEWTGRYCRLNDDSHESACRVALRKECGLE